MTEYWVIYLVTWGDPGAFNNLKPTILTIMVSI